MLRVRTALLISAMATLFAFAPAALGASQRAVCPGPVASGTARCNAHVVVDPNGKPRTNPAPAGLKPADLQGAYQLPASPAGAGQTIAIVDAYDDPTAAQDLATYRSTMSLPPCGSGCFRKVSQRGDATLPAVNASWAQEISLDLDMASAVCPSCNILLVEADNSYMTSLGAAVNTAVRLGASVVSNSYGGREYSTETSDDLSYFKHPGVPITVSSGDSGYGVEYPAASQYVTAVGGTSLKVTASHTRSSETAWSGAGSGCSAYEPAATSLQPSLGGCTGREVADVSAVADPYTGVAVYDSTSYQGRAGWMVFGGTSAAAPIIAGAYALAGNGASSTADTLYQGSGSLFDVLTGSNGSCGTTATPSLCAAGTGFDGPTGLGSPNGIGAF